MTTGMQHIMIPRWPTLVILGLLFLRALVPAGVMLAPMGGSLALVLCETAITESEEPRQHHHYSGHDHVTHHEGAHADPTCPYAQSGGPAPLPTVPVLATAAIIDQLVVPTAATQTLLTFGPIRRQTSRGPPTLA